MFDSILHLLWNPPEAYLILFALAALDAVFPVVPSETGLILAGILCVVGPHLSLGWVLTAAALGAFVGDNSSYALGRFVGRPVQRRFFPGERGRKALDWARSQLDRRGGLLVVVSRFVPGGRTATTFSCGLTHFPWLRFVAFEAVAAVSWSLYGGPLRLLRGRLFPHPPWL